MGENAQQSMLITLDDRLERPRNVVAHLKHQPDVRVAGLKLLFQGLTLGHERSPDSIDNSTNFEPFMALIIKQASPASSTPFLNGRFRLRSAAELTTSGVDLPSLRLAHRRRHAASAQDRQEPQNRPVVGAFVRQAGDRVVRDQIHMRLRLVNSRASSSACSGRSLIALGA